MQTLFLPYSVKQRLGHAPDQEIAKQVSCSAEAIAAERNRLRIAPHPSDAVQDNHLPTHHATSAQSRPFLNDEDLRFLGWASDVAVSKRLSITTLAVAKLREMHGIQGLRLRSEPPKGLVDDLGNHEDERIAERYGVKVKWVRKLRKKLGIASYRDQNPPSIPQGALDMLGKMSDRGIAKLYGGHAVNYRQARIERGIAPFQPKNRALYEAELDAGLKFLLTWASDTEVLRQTGISVFKIKKYRQAHDIPLLGLKSCPPPGLIEAIRSSDKSVAILVNEFATSTILISEIKAKLEASTARCNQAVQFLAD